MVYPRYFEIGKLAHLGVWPFGGGNRAFFLIKVEKHFYLVADMHVFGHIALGKEDLTFLPSVKIQSEINGLDYSEGVVVSESEHVS